MRPSLLLYGRLASASDAFMGNVTLLLPDWQRTDRAIGGHWQGDGTITEGLMSRHAMRQAFNTWLGCRFVERAAAIDTWEGEITRIDFAKDGVIMSRSLDPEHWHNRVKTSYTDYLLGTPTATAWAVNTSSSRIFGGCEYIDTVGRNYGTESACTVRDTRLTERAFPRTLPVGVTQELGARLTIHCSGYVFSMNRRYRESDIAASPISSHITTLAGAAEFVTPGRVVATGASAAVKASAVPERLWPIAEELVLVGGSANERWVGGVWAGRQFHYEPAETEVTHYWRQGKLYTRAWSRVHPCFVTPNSIVRSCGFSESLPGGDLVWDSARDFYVEEVEYSIQDNQARLTPYGGGYPLVVGG